MKILRALLALALLLTPMRALAQEAKALTADCVITSGKVKTAAAHDGDPMGLAALADFSRWLGYGLALIADVFDPDLIVLATGYETGADHLPEEVLPRTADGDLDLFLGAFPRGRDDLVLVAADQLVGQAGPESDDR